MNPHGYSLHRHDDEQSRQHTCPFCLKVFQQTTAILKRGEESAIVYLPKVCPTCTRRTLKNRRTNPRPDL